MGKDLQVAMLEDDSDDRYLTEETLGSLGFKFQIRFYTRSDELFASLQQTKPNLLLVDYNSTPENAVGVLRRLKLNEAYRSIPVVVLCDSHHPKYHAECYAEGASSVVIKPRTLEETKKKIKSFFTYWMEVAES